MPLAFVIGAAVAASGDESSGVELQRRDPLRIALPHQCVQSLAAILLRQSPRPGSRQRLVNCQRVETVHDLFERNSSRRL